jgi:hypothetical protein
MTQPGLDLGDVGFVLQSVGGCGCPEAMDAQTLDLNPSHLRVGRYDGIDTVGRDAGTVNLPRNGMNSGTFLSAQ